MGNTEIQWAQKTWNPTEGCTPVSTGCKFCYAKRIHPRLFGSGPASRPFEQVVTIPSRLDEPLHWRKPARIFVSSRSDLFHPEVPDDFIDRAFAVMALSPRHTFIVLTKRPERMKAWCTYAREEEGGEIIHGRWGFVDGRARQIYRQRTGQDFPPGKMLPFRPLPHLWLGVSCENQEQADKRIPILLQTPAAVRFVSLEPLLGPIDLKTEWMDGACSTTCPRFGFVISNPTLYAHEHPRIDWLIVGGESGGPQERSLVEKCDGTYKDARAACAGGNRDWRVKPEPLSWVRAIRDQCHAAGVHFFFKQFGGPRPTSGGRILDGRTWDEYPKGT